MRIAWFTPFNPRSAIGEFSRRVTAALATFADVEIWTSDDVPLLSSDLRLVGYHPDSSDLEGLSERDVVIYNLGNYLAFHGDIYRVSRRHAGIVILHDRALHHLFSDMWLMGDEPNSARYVERMNAHYGEEGATVAIATLQGKRTPPWECEDDVLRFPLYEEGITNALGVAVHAKAQARDVRERWLGPVASLDLPCYADVLRRASVAPVPRVSGRVRLLTLGHLNPNKQVHRVIEALAADPALAARTEYRVVGPDGGFTEYSRSLERSIARSSPPLDVKLVGWLADEALEREMERAHIYVNLRHPNIEGGSASLMKQLAYGRPVVCFDSGIFSELPEDAVVRVPVGDVAGLTSALRDLVASQDRRLQVGARARQVAASRSEHDYAESLMQLIEQSQRTAPSLTFLDSVAQQLGDMKADRRLPVFDTIATDFARILAV